MEKIYKKRIWAENVLIILLGGLALATLTASFFPESRISGLFMHALEMKKMSARVFAVLLLIDLYNLYERKRMAWNIALILLMLNFMQHFYPPVHFMFHKVILVDMAGLALLLWFRADFCCQSEKRSVKRAVFMLIIAIAGVFFNAGISYHFVKEELSGAPSRVLLIESIEEAFGILFGTTNSNAPGFPNVRFENFMFWFSWVCIFFALIYSLLPWIERRLWTENDMQRARKIVMRYGQNPASYLTLENDKMLYFSRCAEGVLPYGVVGSTVVVNGDPICAPEDFGCVLEEFRQFCQKSNHKLVFLSITDRYLEEYKKLGFGTVKCGEEAVFDIQNYNIAGKKGAKMRMNVNHATKAGLEVHEYKPLEQKDAATEKAMNEITHEWLADKKSGLLTFTMGTVGLERPMDRRYFYACDQQGHIYGYNVYCPYDAGRGYMADITRRSHDAPSGITEKIMYEAFQTFKEEGVQKVSLGIAPLANIIREGEKANSLELLLNFVYEHLNACYGFKNLYKAKENYSPTEWVSGYYAWFPAIPVPSMFYAMVRIQNKLGVRDFVKSFVAEKIDRFRNKRAE